MLQKRYEFVLLYDVQDGNPNGDPDAGNLPRIDAETGQGIVTDVCLKRKIRNYVSITRGDASPYELFIKEKAVLNKQQQRAYTALDVSSSKEKKGNTDKARNWMCENFYDIRTFGAVMSTGDYNCGQVKGPIQMTFSRSIDPVVTGEHTITRMAVTTEREAEKQDGDNRTMGRKYTIPYGLYRCHGFVSAHFAQKTGFSETDLSLFWEALQNMFDHDHSAARGLMATQQVIVFEHQTALGESPAQSLFSQVVVERKHPNIPARTIGDYEIRVANQLLPHTPGLHFYKVTGSGTFEPAPVLSLV